MRKQGRSLSLITRSKHQLFELGVAAQRVEIDITLSANSELRLEVKRAPKRLQRRIERCQSGRLVMSWLWWRRWRRLLWNYQRSPENGLNFYNRLCLENPRHRFLWSGNRGTTGPRFLLRV